MEEILAILFDFNSFIALCKYIQLTKTDIWEKCCEILNCYLINNLIKIISFIRLGKHEICDLKKGDSK